jgi:hypothetical protein
MNGDITAVSLGFNGLNGTIPSSVGSMTELNFMRLGSNYLKGTIPSSLASLTKLTDLSLAVNALTGLVPPLPFKQYSSGCNLDNPNHPSWRDYNHFKCPLPAGSEQCKYYPGAPVGVHCK